MNTTLKRLRFPGAAVCLSAWLLGCALTLSPRASAQTEPALGDVARKARDQHKSEEQAGAGTSDQTKHLAAELEQDDEEQPPAGFAVYRSTEYSLWVPAPFSVEGRDENGELLATSSENGVKTYVFAANPIPASAGLGEVAFNELVRGFWGRYGGLGCNKGEGSLHRCYAGGRILTVSIPSAPVQFLQHENEIIPVLCFHTATVVTNNATWYSKEQIRLIQNGYGAEQASMRNCETLFGSVRVREHAISSGKPALPPKVAARQNVALHDSGAEGTDDGTPSLGAVARATKRQTAQQPAAKHSFENDGDSEEAPPGFRALSKTLCTSVCWQESLVVPSNGKRLDAGAYVIPLDDHTSGLIAFGSQTFGPAYATLATWVGGLSPLGDDRSTRPVKINGEDATVQRERLKGSREIWVEIHLILASPKANYQIACMAPENRLSDMDGICTTVFDSLRVR